MQLPSPSSPRRRPRLPIRRVAPLQAAPPGPHRAAPPPSSPSPSARRHSAVLAGRILSPLRSSSVSRFSGTLRDGARKSGERTRDRTRTALATAASPAAARSSSDSSASVLRPPVHHLLPHHLGRQGSLLLLADGSCWLGLGPFYSSAVLKLLPPRHAPTRRPPLRLRSHQCHASGEEGEEIEKRKGDDEVEEITCGQEEDGEADTKDHPGQEGKEGRRGTPSMSSSETAAMSSPTNSSLTP
ncbi:hypothetical protein DAI22_01g486550 [Oryza sativa Japonica Group]|nr:hypothetical protein DAI22_01g486550 [Oryza sativa Japonica Group]